MAGLNHYRFRSIWVVDVDPDEAFGVLANLEDYPSWWPEVREVHPLDGDVVAVRARSLLPYDLRFTMARSREDRDAGVLEVAMTGDLEGFARWNIRAAPPGSRLLFEEEVVTHKKALNWLSPVAKPAFKLNHTLMMRHGAAGLQTFLAGYSRAPTRPD